MSLLPSFKAKLAGNKKGLLKTMVRKVKPTNLNIKKASIKGIIAKGAPGPKVKPSIIGGSAFPGLGGSQRRPGSVVGSDVNLGVTGVF